MHCWDGEMRDEWADDGGLMHAGGYLGVSPLLVRDAIQPQWEYRMTRNQISCLDFDYFLLITNGNNQSDTKLFSL